MTTNLRGWWTVQRGWIARTSLYWAGFFLLAIVGWLKYNFGAVTLPQLVYYLHFWSGVVAGADQSYVVSFCLQCLLVPTLGAALTILVPMYLRSKHAERVLRTASFKAAFKARVSARGFRNLDRMWRTLPFVVCAVSVGTLSWYLSAFDSVLARFRPDRFAGSYVESREVKLSASQPKNLVLIYVESLEASYGDKEIFGEDLLQEANALPGSSFDFFSGVPGVTHTMAGIVATQCGVPLQFMRPSWTPPEQRESFLGGAKCLGDVLRDFGYHNVFIGGAELSFSAKNSFLASHSYDEMYGRTEWEQAHIGDRYGAWGLYDDDLLRVAKTKLLELAGSGQLFNLTILTLDTHYPGHYSTTCKERGAARFEDIVKCTSRQVAEFIHFATEHDLLRNTNFVIVGDHLAAPDPTPQLQRNTRRRIFNKFISTTAPPKNREHIVAFDLFPTILEFVGVEVEGNRLALGCSAFFPNEGKCPGFGPTDVWLAHLDYSRTYAGLWIVQGDHAPQNETPDTTKHKQSAGAPTVP